MFTDFILKYRRMVVVCVHVFLIIASNLLAFLLRFEWAVPPAYYQMIGITLPVIVLVRLGVFYFFDLYSGLWKYVSTRDLVKIIKPAIFSSAVVGLVPYPILNY